MQTKPIFVLANTLDIMSKVQDGVVVFKLSDVKSVWFKEAIGSKPYVQVKYNDGIYQFLDMNYDGFKEFVDVLDEADLD
jgi:hypothetical protein